MTCKDCLHYDVCGGYTPTDLDRDVFDYCREGRADEIPDIEEWCSGFKDKSCFPEVVRCGGCIWWEERDRNGFVGRCNNPLNGLTNEFSDDEDFCSYGERKTEGG